MPLAFSRRQKMKCTFSTFIRGPFPCKHVIKTKQRGRRRIQSRLVEHGSILGCVCKPNNNTTTAVLDLESGSKRSKRSRISVATNGPQSGRRLLGYRSFALDICGCCWLLLFAAQFANAHTQDDEDQCDAYFLICVETGGRTVISASGTVQSGYRYVWSSGGWWRCSLVLTSITLTGSI